MKRASLLTACLAIAVSAAVGAVAKQPLPPAIEAGSFEGTWYYVDPGFRVAIFIAGDATGLLRIRYHVKVNAGTEYETDAGGYVKSLDEDGNVLELLFTGTAESSNLITGHYERTVHQKKGAIVASADFRMYRTEGGRKLVLHYPLYKIETTDAAGRTHTSSETDVVRLFRKASEIVVDFDEIPF